MKYRGCLVAAVVAGVLALSGCTWSTTAPDLPGPTDEDIAAVQALRQDAYWEFSGLGDRIDRPDVAIVRKISPDEWATVIAECMNAAGFDTYRASGTGLSSTVAPPELADAEALAKFICETEYPTDDQAVGVYSAAQREYIYDYYTRWLVPCLEARGYEIDAPPNRKAFLGNGFGLWNPYYSTAFDDVASGIEMKELQAVCEPMPPGFLDE